jgi:hypothetical protein
MLDTLNKKKVAIFEQNQVQIDTSNTVIMALQHSMAVIELPALGVVFTAN